MRQALFARSLALLLMNAPTTGFSCASVQASESSELHRRFEMGFGHGKGESRGNARAQVMLFLNCNFVRVCYRSLLSGLSLRGFEHLRASTRGTFKEESTYDINSVDVMTTDV